MQRYCFFLIYANIFEKKCFFQGKRGVFVVLGGIGGIDAIVAIDAIDAIDVIDVIVAIDAIDVIVAIGILAGGDACAPGHTCAHRTIHRGRDARVSSRALLLFLCYFLRFDYLFSSCCFRLFFESFSSRFRD